MPSAATESPRLVVPSDSASVDTPSDSDVVHAADPVTTSPGSPELGWPTSSASDRSQGIVRPRLIADYDYGVIGAGFAVIATGFVMGFATAAGVDQSSEWPWNGIPIGGAPLSAILTRGGTSGLGLGLASAAGGLQLLGLLMVIGAADNPSFDVRAFGSPISASAGPEHVYVGWTQRF